jgi:hypothetical protein
MEGVDDHIAVETQQTTIQQTENNNNNASVGTNEVERLQMELEKERQSKSALENMIIVSSLNMIGKIEGLEKKHEAQIELLREQLQQYMNKEQDLEEDNKRLREQLDDMKVKQKDKVKKKDLDKKKRKNGGMLLFISFSLFLPLSSSLINTNTQTHTLIIIIDLLA